ncbi:LysR substrate-binding domain-containing protein [Undibacterium terreum]|uniref:LysR family transcriptional regulator n=1 Tax=Undibacterium terreum TaxID=1224302 RepID=A0A916UBR4_9BURK|nr:LysR substrate-binding domain-containing protein [Undibacterium terreum]GGC67213.1 LysR family transcriptional regulator [Undibacterium terreum]
MHRITFDLDVLRSFVTGIELGSFAKAADKLGRSTSAVSAQLKKLEDQVDAPILRKAGRGLVLTPAGETLLAYARRLLELNDEAATALRGVDLEGWIRLGMPEDFGERVLTDVLGRFTRAHPKVRIEAKVARHAILLDSIASGNLDLALTWDAGVPIPQSETVGELQLRWIGPAGSAALPKPTVQDPLPLIAFEAPCLMRTAATAALDQAGIPWRISFASPSLSGIWAAVAAGLGVTVRTDIGLPANLQVLGPDICPLPALPTLGLIMYRAEDNPSPATQLLGEIMLDAIQSPSRPLRASKPAPLLRVASS